MRGKIKDYKEESQKDKAFWKPYIITVKEEKQKIIGYNIKDISDHRVWAKTRVYSTDEWNCCEVRISYPHCTLQFHWSIVTLWIQGLYFKICGYCWRSGEDKQYGKSVAMETREVRCHGEEVGKSHVTRQTATKTWEARILVCFEMTKPTFFNEGGVVICWF